MKYGGTVIELAHKTRKIRKPRIVLICDVSRSMDSYSRFLLQFIYALQHVIGKVESFVFSTSLTRVTPYFKSEDIQSALDRIADEVHDWSGGTRIGQSLMTFNDEWARRAAGQAHDRVDPQRRSGYRRRRDPRRGNGRACASRRKSHLAQSAAGQQRLSSARPRHEHSSASH